MQIFANINGVSCLDRVNSLTDTIMPDTTHKMTVFKILDIWQGRKTVPERQETKVVFLCLSALMEFLGHGMEKGTEAKPDRLPNLRRQN